MQAHEARMNDLTSALGSAIKSSDESQRRIEELTAAVMSARFDAALSAAKTREESGKRVEKMQRQKKAEAWNEKKVLSILRRGVEGSEAEIEALRMQIDEDRINERAALEAAFVNNAEVSELLEVNQKMRRTLDQRELARARQREDLVSKIATARQLQLREVNVQKDEAALQSGPSLVEGCNCEKCLGILRKRSRALEIQMETSRREHAKEVEATLKEAAGLLARSLLASRSSPLGSSLEAIQLNASQLALSAPVATFEDGIDMSSFALSERIMSTLRCRALEIHNEAERIRSVTYKLSTLGQERRVGVGMPFPGPSYPSSLSSLFKISTSTRDAYMFQLSGKSAGAKAMVGVPAGGSGVVRGCEDVFTLLGHRVPGHDIIETLVLLSP